MLDGARSGGARRGGGFREECLQRRNDTFLSNDCLLVSFTSRHRFLAFTVDVVLFAYFQTRLIPGDEWWKKVPFLGLAFSLIL